MLGVIIAIFSILFAILSWRKTTWAISLIIFALPSYLIRFHLGPIPMTLLEVMILILFVVWVVKLIWQKQLNQISLSNYRWWILLFLITSAIAIYVSENRLAAMGIWKAYFFEPILFFLIFINSIREKKDWQLVIRAFGASALLVAIPAIIQKFTGWGIPNEFWRAEETRRVTSWFGYPNAVGLYLASIIVLFFGKLIDEIIRKASRVWEKVFALAVVVLSAGSIFWAGSEGAMAGGVIGLFFLGIFYPNKKLRIATLVIIVLAALSVAVFPLPRHYFIEKVTMRDLSGQIRAQQWRETWKMLDDGRIISGAGLSNYQASVEPYHQDGIFVDDGQPNFVLRVWQDKAFREKVWQPTEIYIYPHNILLNFWSEIGFFGMLVVFLLLLKLFINYLRVYRQESKNFYIILLAVMVAIIVHGLVDVPYFKNDLSALWWLVFAMGVVLVKRKEILIK